MGDVVLVLLAVLLVLPVVEFWTVLIVAGWVGVGWTLVSLFVATLTGLWLLRREGLAVWRRANAELAAGRVPTRSLVNGTIGVLGAVLLVVPGFLTAAAGALLLLPPTRALLRPVAVRWMRRRAARAGVMNAVFVDVVSRPTSIVRRTRSPWGTVIGGTVVDVEYCESVGVDAEVVDVEVERERALPPVADER